MSRLRPKTISITAADFFIKSNLQDFQHMAEADLAIAADAEATLPALIEEVKRRSLPPAAVGAALANRKYGRLSINIQTDGDLN